MEVESVQVDESGNATRSEADLAHMVRQVAEAVPATAIICVTRSAVLPQKLTGTALRPRLVAATVNEETYAALAEAGLEAIRLPLYAADKYSQVRHVLSVAVRSGKITAGDFIICAIGSNVYPEEGDLIVLTDVDPGIERLVITDLLKLTDGIRPRVMETTLMVACRIARVIRRGGERIGAIFILGDSLNVLKDSRQLIPNPFHGHGDRLRQITNPDIHDALVEFSKLDGAFVIRGDGFIQSAGVFLATADEEMQLPTGLGTRHIAAAAATARSAATAVVVSATDGNVRIFSDGRLVLQMDLDVPYGPVILDE
jgi:DNA integrity scanning protein DisA with diadenylate cyclase activity